VTLWAGALGLAFAAVALLLALAPKHDFQGACVAPRTVDTLGPRIYDNHRAVTVSPGRIVTVQLSAGASQPWPWRSPRSSDEAILTPVPLCFDPTNVSSLPVQLTPFKATAPGTTTITAESVTARPDDAFVLTVTVTP
jgi:hypothetical protein